ncbi:hypothetical protein FJTKL_07397 [Diaporthe vaccinii]|uniref:Uncharacterized protein n=1 Tax=Diaporthe vaccinii TaxID=105482 RepID=A0ABR4ETY1_9PEZI
MSASLLSFFFHAVAAATCVTEPAIALNKGGTITASNDNACQTGCNATITFPTSSYSPIDYNFSPEECTKDRLIVPFDAPSGDAYITWRCGNEETCVRVIIYETRNNTTSPASSVAAFETSNTPVLGCPAQTSAGQFTSNTASETFRSPVPTDSTIQDFSITGHSSLETSTASLLCTTLGAAPGLGRNRNACVCTAESTTVTLPMQVITSDESRLVSCNYRSIPSTWSTISTSTAVWTDSANCQVCSQAGVANPRQCGKIPDCTPAFTTIYTTTYITTSFTTITLPTETDGSAK